MDLAEEIVKLKTREKMLVEMTTLLSDKMELSQLLERIVSGLRTMTGSDAGSLYVVENGDTLRFSVAQNDSKDIPFSSFTLPISHATISGYVAHSGETLRFDDVYKLDSSRPFSFNNAFDKKFGYRTKSMIVVPMRNNKNEIVGVVQLINKKKDSFRLIERPELAEELVVPYTDEDEDFLKILSAEAGIAIERSSLYEGIERLLTGMIESSAASIESRDKTTAGHSQRIACYMVVLSKRINKATEGFWKDINFTSEQIRELFYAAMLHDIGKIGVREHVLIKANKLTDNRMRTIYMKICLEVMHDPSRRGELMEIWEFLQKVNIPSFLSDADFSRLTDISKLQVRDVDGAASPLLDELEFENLAVRRGNLTDSERKEIESHVAHSLEILKRIPWTDDLQRVPIIAGTHHEKLNGKGYPKGLTKDEIPFEGRMLAVCDVFEALTAMDRPYKKAMPVEKALEIIQMEAKAQSLQKEIVDFFTEQRIYECVSDELRKNFSLNSDQILAME